MDFISSRANTDHSEPFPDQQDIIRQFSRGGRAVSLRPLQSRLLQEASANSGRSFYIQARCGFGKTMMIALLAQIYQGQDSTKKIMTVEKDKTLLHYNQQTYNKGACLDMNKSFDDSQIGEIYYVSQDDLIKELGTGKEHDWSKYVFLCDETDLLFRKLEPRIILNATSNMPELRNPYKALQEASLLVGMSATWGSNSD